ncbi:hypothetical protein ABZU86_26480 [Streptomyces sp. NPDC005271]|uniref:hypothetical protein n=1 Tax=unclassified Streptomyces TaxID=2593676 RepID=UPI0033A932A9
MVNWRGFGRLVAAVLLYHFTDRGQWPPILGSGAIDATWKRWEAAPPIVNLTEERRTVRLIAIVATMGVIATTLAVIASGVSVRIG